MNDLYLFWRTIPRESVKKTEYLDISAEGWDGGGILPAFTVLITMIVTMKSSNRYFGVGITIC